MLLFPKNHCLDQYDDARICVDTGRGCSLLLTSPLAASQNFEVSDRLEHLLSMLMIFLFLVQDVQHSR
jgi:hypothetical protein